MKQNYIGFDWLMDNRESVICPENRFGDDTVGKGANLTYSLCPQNVNFTVQGDLSTHFKKLMTINITPCNQLFLDANFPGETCVSVEESKAIFSEVLVIYTLKTEYFDNAEFTGNPIKDSFYTFIMLADDKSTSFQYLSATQN
eukprot:CAMPEP_0170567260 /NCGR_PEP_ID=MMETSP0211-20121228/80365_1 /TAXON_ID=311385 /ORGANISM="Pseudokeronopsis sp., Strain OXSARD2" /LENGTH=142 /DNA_ID=CAMNT_0010888667 /DNA_START=412 /DNA_END=840 /DNA_ORIENTATION=-